MKYAINTEHKGYMPISFSDKINFTNDQLLFKNIKEAYKYLYYAPNNTFKVFVDPHTLKYINLINTLVKHNATIKFVNNSASTSDFVKVNLKYQKMKMRLTGVEFKPTLMKTTNGNNTIYVLDGYVVNVDMWDYRGSTVNGILDPNKLPFDVNIKEVPYKSRVVDKKHKWGAKKEIYTYTIFDKQIKKNKFIPKLYIYNIKKMENKTELRIFFQGYELYNKEFIANVSDDFTYIENEDWKYYGKISHHFKSNFYTMIIDSQDFKLSFKYENKPARILFSRHLQSSVIINDLYVENYRSHIIVSSEIEKHKSPQYIDFVKNIKNNEESFYLFNDRQNKADDNAEALYRYYQQNSDKQIYFAVEKNSNSWRRLEMENFNLIEFGSYNHKLKYLQATKIISSHAARRIYDPFYPSKEFINLENRKFVFLQHGIVMGKHHGFLDRVNNQIDLVITSTKQEKEIFKDFSGFDNIEIAGLSRYDNYQLAESDKREYIVYAPSWNVLYKDNLEDSIYAKEIKKVINSKLITNVLRQNELKLYVVMHPEFINMNIGISNSEYVEVLGHGNFLYSDILKNTVGLITDYSSLLFDVLYQRKFVIEHQPYQLHHENSELTGYQQSLYKSYDITQLEKILICLSKNNFKLDNNRQQVINGFFAYDDNMNCQRNYDAIEKLK